MSEHFYCLISNPFKQHTQANINIHRSWNNYRPESTSVIKQGAEICQKQMLFIADRGAVNQRGAYFYQACSICFQACRRRGERREAQEHVSGKMKRLSGWWRMNIRKEELQWWSTRSSMKYSACSVKEQRESLQIGCWINIGCMIVNPKPQSLQAGSTRGKHKDSEWGEVDMQSIVLKSNIFFFSKIYLSRKVSISISFRGLDFI